MTPRIILTTGEPGGIGPDLCLKIAKSSWPCGIVVAGDPDLLAARACKLGVEIRIIQVDPGQDESIHVPGTLRVWPVSRVASQVCGQLDPANAAYVLDVITGATRSCMEGFFDAMVTLPVHKGIINEAGIPFTGHTEYIAAHTGGDPLMMLVAPGLRVALATTHIPLSSVSGAISRESLSRSLEVLQAGLVKCFGISSPRILVAGLNPHAGEGGHLGREELEVIEPVIDALRDRGMQVSGPLPADTLFLPGQLADADAVMAMYHDQGLPVLKHMGFGRAVNITLGLPVIRTSVDHGTALGLAGTGRADEGSAFAALEAALAMSVQSAPQTHRIIQGQWA